MGFYFSYGVTAQDPETLVKNNMAVLLDDYDAVGVHNHRTKTFTFFIPLSGARDIALADLATELTVFNNLMIYKGDKYIALSGVRKQMHPEDGRWVATIESERL